MSVALLASCFPDPPERAADATEDTALPDTEAAETADDTSSDTDTAASDAQEDTRTGDASDASDAAGDGSGGLCPVASGPCDDGNPCTEGDECVAVGRCEGEARGCDDGELCTDDFCDGATGACRHVGRAGEPCDDGLQCTTDDACDAAGACVGTPIPCDDDDPCTVDACVEDTVTCAGFKPFRYVRRSMGLAGAIHGEVLGRGGRSPIGPMFSGYFSIDSQPGRRAALPLFNTTDGAPYPVVVSGASPDEGVQLFGAVWNGVGITAVGSFDRPPWSGGVPFVAARVGTQQGSTWRMPELERFIAIISTRANGYLALAVRNATVAEPGPMALVSISSFGEPQSTFHFGEAADIPKGMVRTSDGGWVVASTAVSPHHATITRIDEQLVTMKRHDLPLDLWSDAANVAIESDEIILAGAAGAIPYRPTGQVRVGAVGLDGDVRWSIVLDGDGMTAARDVAVTIREIAVVGSRDGDAWIAVMDRTGALKWTDRYETGEYSASYMAVQADLGGTWVAGGTAIVSPSSGRPSFPIFARYLADGATSVCPP